MKDELPIVVIDSVLCMDDWYPKGLALRREGDAPVGPKETLERMWNMSGNILPIHKALKVVSMTALPCPGPLLNGPDNPKKSKTVTEDTVPLLHLKDVGPAFRGQECILPFTQISDCRQIRSVKVTAYEFAQRHGPKDSNAAS